MFKLRNAYKAISNLLFQNGIPFGKTFGKNRREKVLNRWSDTIGGGINFMFSAAVKAGPCLKLHIRGSGIGIDLYLMMI